MAKAKPFIEVTGTSELRRLLRKVESKDINKALREANKGAANVIAERAKELVPVSSGRLKKSIGSRASQSSGSIKAGSAGRVPYAGPIHFGWFRRSIKAQPFLNDAISDKLSEAREVYDELMAEVFKIIGSRF